MSNTSRENLGWGKISAEGAEIWDANPVFLGEHVTWKDWAKLLFYPKKWFLYRWVWRHVRRLQRTLPLSGGGRRGSAEESSEGFTKDPTQTSPGRGGGQYYPRILDVGCGTGSTLIDFKKMFGRSADVVGVDVVNMQVDLARDRVKKNGLVAQVEWFDGEHLPFADASFDAVYTSDVLGHVKDVRAWLAELHRVLKPGGALAMFSESKLGKHAWIRNYLFKRGLNVDPHAEFHISLYSKTTLLEFLEASGFDVRKMYSAFWASFFVHPDEFYEKLQVQRNFFFLRQVNKILYKIKKKFHPYTTAAAELYGLLEMLVVGRFIESQGCVILARKK